MSLTVKTYSDAQAFLEMTRAHLESNEAANSLMLGICGQLVRYPQSYTALPCLKTVQDVNKLVLAAIMTPPHKLVVYAHQGDLEGGATFLVQDLVREGRQPPGVLGLSAVAECVAHRWTEAAQMYCRLERRQALHELMEAKGPVPERGRLRVASEEDVELVAEWMYGFRLEIFGNTDSEDARIAAERQTKLGNVFLWEDPSPVSMAMKSRPTTNGISVSSVYTPPDVRGRGYATACVGELSRLLLKSGWSYCALFADLENSAANHVYRKLGYKPICVYDEYIFSKRDEREPATV